MKSLNVTKKSVAMMAVLFTVILTSLLPMHAATVSSNAASSISAEDDFEFLSNRLFSPGQIATICRGVAGPNREMKDLDSSNPCENQCCRDFYSDRNGGSTEEFAQCIQDACPPTGL